MMLFADKVLSFILMLFFFGFCIFIHEFGHLLAGLWRKLHIERFSFGFGPAIWKRVYKGIEYRVSWIPFGGYVALPQLEPTDNPESMDGRPLPPGRPLDRILTAAAGPLFNILFGLLLTVIVWQVGYMWPKVTKTFFIGELPATYQTAAGETQPTPEFAAGLRPGDEIIAINGKTLEKGWEEAKELIVFSPGGKVRVDFIRDGEKESTAYKIVLNPNLIRSPPVPFMKPVLFSTRVLQKVLKGSVAAEAGLQAGDVVLEFNGEKVLNLQWLVQKLNATKPAPLRLKVRRGKKELEIGNLLANPAIRNGKEIYTLGIELDETTGLQKVLAGSAAAAAGLEAGDVVLEINGEAVKDHDWLAARLGKSELELIPVELKIRRGSQLKIIANLRPRYRMVAGVKGYLFGISVEPPMELYRPTPLAQIKRLWSLTGRSIRSLFDRGNPIGAKHLSGPVGIAQGIYMFFSISFILGLQFVAWISFLLAVFNLLPLPILDGGHIGLALVELITSRKIPARVLRPVFYVFFVLLIGLMLYVTVHDIGGLFPARRSKAKKPPVAAEPAPARQPKPAQPETLAPAAPVEK